MMCKTCGTPVKGSGRKYCNDECKLAHVDTKEEVFHRFCKTCGMPVKGKGRKYCNDECKEAYIRPEGLEYKYQFGGSCRTCGGSTAGMINGIRYCSEECDPNFRTCKTDGCNNTFLSYGEKSRLYCSEDCKWTKIKCKAEDCENTFPNHSGRRYCSEGCRKKKKIVRGKYPERIYHLVCKTCLDSFTANCNARLYCKDECDPRNKECITEGCINKFFDSTNSVFHCVEHKVNVVYPDELRKRLSECKKGRKFTSEHKENLKRSRAAERKRYNGPIKPSKEELSLIPVLEKRGFAHTGNGTFWRKWKDGSNHNPDFVNEEDRIVLEYFGKYWHREDRGKEESIKEFWREIGWGCEIIWSEELPALLEVS